MPLTGQRPIRVAGLQFTVAALGAAIGALMLVAPHQFGAVVYAPLKPHLIWLGAGFLLTSAGLFSVSLFTAHRVIHAAVHLASGLFLLVLGLDFGRTGSWGGLITFWSAKPRTAPRRSPPCAGRSGTCS